MNHRHYFLPFPLYLFPNAFVPVINTKSCPLAQCSLKSSKDGHRTWVDIMHFRLEGKISKACLNLICSHCFVTCSKR